MLLKGCGQRYIGGVRRTHLAALRVATWPAVIAVVMAMMFSQPARAGSSGPQCSIPDLAVALGGTATTVFSGACTTADNDPELYLVVAALSAAVAGAGAQGQQACTDIQNTINQINNKLAPVGKLKSQLGNFDLGDEAQGILDALTDVTSVVEIASCSCGMEKALNADGQVFGACLQDALCAAGKWVGGPCKCNPVAAQPANCSINSFGCAEELIGPTLPNGQPNPQFAEYCSNLIVKGPPGTTPVTQTKSAVGITLTTGGQSSNAQNQCSAVNYCLCPKPMVLTWINYQPSSLSNPNSFQMAMCECPEGTSPPSSLTGPVSSTCVCNEGPDAGKPAPGDGKCAPVCKNKEEVPVAGGGCCKPSQVSSCGECCGAGQEPDPTTGQCKSIVSPPPRFQ